jgi:hypothetical protein
VPSQWVNCVRPKGVVPEYLLVCGGRDFDDYDLLEWKLERVTYWWDDVIVCHGHGFNKSGRPPGADRLAELWAEKNWYDRQHFHADWDKHGKAAGPMRNREMCRFVESMGGLLVAFWDGESPGTKNCIEEFRKLSPTRVVIQRY